MPGQFINTGTNPGGKLSLINNSNSGNLTMAPNSVQTYTIGEAALGGIIAYINGGGTTGTSGFVVDPNSLNNAIWGCSGLLIPGTSQAIGTGYQNTQAILTNCATRPIAASIASQWTGGGYTDWYLPSVDELYQVWYYSSIHYGPITGLQPYIYWSSSDSTNVFNPISAFTMNFVGGGSGAELKSTIQYVLSIRSF